MRCLICRGGEVEPGTTTLTAERGATTLVLRGVPARVCSQCGEAYFDEATTKRLEEIAERVYQTGAQVAVQEYVAPTAQLGADWRGGRARRAPCRAP